MHLLFIRNPKLFSARLESVYSGNTIEGSNPSLLIDKCYINTIYLVFNKWVII